MSPSLSYPRGPRLTFRDFEKPDIAAVHEYISDPEVTRWSTWGPNTLEQTASFVEFAAQQHASQERSAFTLAAVLDRDPRPGKSGFTLEGRLRSHRLVNGVRRDSLLFSVLPGEHH